MSPDTSAAGLFLDERIEDLEKVNRVNFMGVIYTLKAGLPGMVARGSGRVLMMSSMMAMYGEESKFIPPHCEMSPLRLLPFSLNQIEVWIHFLQRGIMGVALATGWAFKCNHRSCP